MDIVDFNKIESVERYKLMSQNIIPRPIAWIVTENQGKINIAPFSYFTGVSSVPPLVMVSIGRNKKGLNEPKDTFKNIKETKKATICLVEPSMKEIMDKTGEVLPFEESEAEKFNIKTKRILDDSPPIIEGVKRAFFTTLYGTFEKEEMATIPFFLKIENMLIDGDFEPLARVGKGYSSLCHL